MTLGLIVLIGGCMAYFIGTTDLVDHEIRNLGATQQLSYQKNELEVSIRNWLQGRPNEGCPSPDLMVNTYTNFALDAASANLEFTQAPNTLMATDVAARTFPAFKCFLHPNRYPQFGLKNFKAKFTRLGFPNYQGLTNEVGVQVAFEFHYMDRGTSSKVFRQSYNFRFRMEAASLSNYTVVFTQTPGGRVFTGDPANLEGTEIKVNGRTLVLGSAPATARLGWFGPDDGNTVFYQGAVELSADHLVVDNRALNFIRTSGFAKIFAGGIVTSAVPSEDDTPGYAYPTSYTSTEAWSEAFNYYTHALTNVLPFTSSLKSAALIPGLGNYYADAQGPNSLSTTSSLISDTAQVFSNASAGVGTSAADVWKTCAPSPSNLGLAWPMVWGNMDTDFTIDLSNNRDATAPPVFCGLIAARKIVVKLNGLDKNTQDYARHYLIGKFFTSEGFELRGKGALIILDGLGFQSEDVSLPGFSVNADAVADNIGALNGLTYRNFFLPFLRPGTTYGSLGPEQAWALPMSVTSWMFGASCTSPALGYRCYQKPNLPEKEVAPGGFIYPRIDSTLPSIYFNARSAL